MRASELIHILQQHSNKEVIVKNGNGLYCPIEEVKASAETIVIKAKDMSAFVIESDFKPLVYEPSVKTSKK